MRSLIFLITSLFTVSANAGLILADNFNDSTINNWTVQTGSLYESGGLLGGSHKSVLTFDNALSDSIGVDAVSNPGLNYVALVLNYTSLSDNLFVKIQDNNSNGLFDRLYFYHGNSGSAALTGNYFFDLSHEVASSYFQVTNNGDGTVSAYVGGTGETFSGRLSHSYSGSLVGLGFMGEGKADNFYVESVIVNEPGSLALLGLGMIAIGLARRRLAH